MVLKRPPRLLDGNHDKFKNNKQLTGRDVFIEKIKPDIE